ncbi:MAG: hypothetical protein L3J76_01120 [Candidatus Hydrothermae bacterium]|nr:hypothetical protein [Candidatus Hydrothermae bacterium]
MTFLLWSMLALSPWKAAGQSFAIPGWAEWQMGYTTEARVFWIMEGALLGSWGWSLREAARLEESARAYAVDHAVQRVGSEPTFWSLVEQYASTADYERELWIEARQRFPNDRQKQEAYVHAHRTTGVWTWHSNDAWFHYSDLRASSRSWENRARVWMGSILTLHLTSAINAFLKARTSSGIQVESRYSEQEIRVGIR